MNKRLVQTTFVGIGLLLAMAGNVVFTYFYFTSRFPGGNDSVPRYYGVRAWLFEGVSPYSEEVSERGQYAIYGRLANDEGEDKARFAYPFYVIFFYAPLAWLNWEWARAIGIVSLELALIVSVIASLRAYRWTPPPWLLAVTIVWALLFYHGARTIILWQFAGIAAGLIALGMWAINGRRDALAGVCFSLATAKPQMMFLILPLLGLWSITARRWRLLASLAIGMSTLIGLSFLLVPAWLTDMLAQIEGYQKYTDIGSPINTLTNVVFPFLGQPVEWALYAALLLWLLWEWWKVRDGAGARFDWTMALTLVITNLVAPRTATTNYVMMIPALMFLFVAAVRTWGTKGTAGVIVTELILLVGLWVLFAATVQGRIEQPPMYLPFPFSLLAGLIIFRFVKQERVS